MLSATEVRNKGFNVIDKLLQKYEEVVISFRGKKRFVVMDIDRFNELRKKELELAYKEVLEDYEKGNYKIVSAKEHIENIKKELNDV